MAGTRIQFLVMMPLNSPMEHDTKRAASCSTTARLTSNRTSNIDMRRKQSVSFITQYHFLNPR